ncbi:MAG: TIGR01459 family HAD-type hydrolase [Hyphomicrobiales bacterium]|nr:TIGR01459 family HAD-type hydrolase [Hyphomicrobiales bacterium]
MNPSSPIPILPGIAALAGNYDVWLCDIWGVIHNGVTVFPAAVAACQLFRAGGGKVLLITNAPRPTDFIEAQLTAMGIHGVHDAIATSGDVTVTLMRERAGQAVFHLGPDRDKPMLDGLDLRRVEPQDAEFILNSGPFQDDTETPEDYRERFKALVARNVPMLCANPDLTVERGGHVIYCAGALAALYEEMGGKVAYAGKPYAPIYDLAFKNIAASDAVPEKAKVLAIGDGVNTDIRGAANHGIDSVFVASGVHVKGSSDGLTAGALETLFAPLPFRPIAAQARLSW